jgi:hypothetical protein
MHREVTERGFAWIFLMKMMEINWWFKMVSSSSHQAVDSLVHCFHAPCFSYLDHHRRQRVDGEHAVDLVCASKQ